MATGRRSRRSRDSRPPRRSKARGSSKACASMRSWPTAPADAFGARSGELEVPPQLEPWVKARGAWRMDAFKDLRISDRWSCNYEMTPDDHPIVGSVPGTPGLYIAAGFSGHGFMHAPA